MSKLVSSLANEAAVVNQGGAMEADTILKNGRISKSLTSRGNFLIIIMLLMTVTLSMVACGGSKGGKILKGTYAISNERGEVSITFSGNKFEMVGNGEKVSEGTYELVEEYKEKEFSRGTIIMKSRDGEEKIGYSLEGNKFTISGMVLTKK